MGMRGQEERSILLLMAVNLLQTVLDVSVLHAMIPS